jgi:hypothetical protein
VFEVARRNVLGILGAILLPFSAASFSAAMEPPGAGEIDNLKQTGDFPARLKNAQLIGNHRIEPYLVDRAVTKARREILSQRGFSPFVVDLADPLPAPPLAWRGVPTTGAPKIFALLIDFADYPHSNAVANINSSLFGNGGLIPTNAAPYESLTAYYKRSSYNLLDFSGGVTLGWYRPAYTRASMAMTTGARESLIKEALASFDATLDFSQFDNNGDGAIDYFVVIWARTTVGQTSGGVTRRLSATAPLRWTARRSPSIPGSGSIKPAPRIPGRSRHESSYTRPGMPWACPITTITTTRSDRGAGSAGST